MIRRLAQPGRRYSVVIEEADGDRQEFTADWNDLHSPEALTARAAQELSIAPRFDAEADWRTEVISPALRCGWSEIMRKGALR